MKKSILGLLTISAAMILASCGGNDNPPASSSTSGEASTSQGYDESTGSESSAAEGKTLEAFVESLAPMNFTTGVANEFEIRFVNDGMAYTKFPGYFGDTETIYARVEGKGMGIFGKDEGEWFFDSYAFPTDQVSVAAVVSNPIDLLSSYDDWFESQSAANTFILEAPSAFVDEIAASLGLGADRIKSVKSVSVELKDEGADLSVNYIYYSGTEYTDVVQIRNIGTTSILDDVSDVILAAKNTTKAAWDQYDEMLLGYAGLSAAALPFSLFSEYAAVSYELSDDHQPSYYIEDIKPANSAADLAAGLLNANAGWRQCALYADYAAQMAQLGMAAIERPVDGSEHDVVIAIIGLAEQPSALYPNGVLRINFSSYTYPDAENLADVNAILGQFTLSGGAAIPTLGISSSIASIALWNQTAEMNDSAKERYAYYGYTLTVDMFDYSLHIEIELADAAGVTYIDNYLNNFATMGYSYQEIQQQTTSADGEGSSSSAAAAGFPSIANVYGLAIYSADESTEIRAYLSSDSYGDYAIIEIGHYTDAFNAWYAQNFGN